jgi:hypothetical protein
MTDEDRIEILAQALWMKRYGIAQVRPEWMAYSKNDPTMADSYRRQAKSMIESARPHKTHSLGWLP